MTRAAGDDEPWDVLRGPPPNEALRALTLSALRALVEERVLPRVTECIAGRADAHAADRAALAATSAWCAALRADGREGARALADRVDRLRDGVLRERRRLDALFTHRRRLVARGHRLIAGVDEVGVGPLAGPVVAAAVILPDALDLAGLAGLDDSKKLAPAVRERLAAAIRAQAVAVGIGEVGPAEIDRMNIRRASLEAMRRAVEGLALRVRPDHVVVDAHAIPGLSMPQTPLIRGDSVDGSIAAASIVAKVHRDALMRALERVHPGYGLDRHMGYGTAEHLDALRRLGASPIHRRSFAPVAAVVGP